MKRLSLLLVAATIWLGAITGAIPAAVDQLALVAAVEAQQDPAKLTVYITKTGEKYHRDGCSSLRRSKFAVSLKDAVARGFEACKNCRPPTLR